MARNAPAPKHVTPRFASLFVPMAVMADIDEHLAYSLRYTPLRLL